MGVAREELAGSPTVEMETDKTSVTAEWRVAWQDRFTFAKEFLPVPVMQPYNIFVAPRARYPGIPGCVADKISIAPWDPESPRGDGSEPNFYPGGARVKVVFNTIVHDEAWQKVSVSMSGEFLELPASGLAWDVPGSAEQVTLPLAGPSVGRRYALTDDNKITKISPIIEHTIEWPNVPLPPFDAIRNCIGKVNAYTFKGIAPECCLFLGCEASRETTIYGHKLWKIVYKFAEKHNNYPNFREPWGWNHYLRTDGVFSGRFIRLKRKVGGGKTILSNWPIVNNNLINCQSIAGFPLDQKFQVKVKIVLGNPGPVQVIVHEDTYIVDSITLAPDRSGIMRLIPANLPLLNLNQFTNVHSTIVQTFETTTRGIVPPVGEFLWVNTRTPFPRFGSFTVAVGAGENKELMSVIGGNGEGPGAFIVIRGRDGTRPRQHAAGTTVQMDNLPIYERANFSALLRSGTFVA